MNKWEYKLVRSLDWDSAIEDRFSKIGRDGWELVAISHQQGDGIKAVFRRLIVSDTAIGDAFLVTLGIFGIAILFILALARIFNF